MKLICAGNIKTGTKSIAHALRILGYKIYDFDEQFLHFDDQFYDLYYRDKVPDFYHMFKDVDVVVDLPCSFFYEELLEAFPEAKVILSVRTDEDAWIRSYKRQVVSFYDTFSWMRYFSPTCKNFYNISIAHLNAAYGTTDPNATYIYLKRYRQHNDRVKAVVPADKLLVFSVDQGWKPLCDFTGKKIPDQPFPYLNKNNTVFKTVQSETEFGSKIERELRLFKMCFAFLVALVAVLIYIFVLY